MFSYFIQSLDRIQKKVSAKPLKKIYSLLIHYVFIVLYYSQEILQY